MLAARPASKTSNSSNNDNSDNNSNFGGSGLAGPLVIFAKVKGSTFSAERCSPKNVPFLPLRFGRGTFSKWNWNFFEAPPKWWAGLFRNIFDSDPTRLEH